jgi:DNA end-binding protein Ku
VLEVRHARDVEGLVAFGWSTPVKMYAATEDHDVRFHQVHAKDGGASR